ncbi:lactonase family protein [Chitinophagaceae bacterium LB-8]|uniref:Lactonase family protein n=1 Tax=Paraflavisolibacter caeni TaxID=2982496 RepID=A0A9X3BHE6_9BACT|nr:lactonase family protein [Paraflavisolibacter caeni]MCU7552234.1 lactonase family protein [Paraflavisolibacter caeni]
MFFFTGSYTEPGAPAPNPMGAGITSCSFNPQNGSIKIIGSQPQRNPSYPVVSADGKILYAAEEMLASENTQLVAYRIHEDGSLSKLNAVPLPGDYACHLAIASQSILVANYVSGDILVYALEHDGKIGSLNQRIQHTGSGVHKERQEAPHPHMMYPVDDDKVYCVDLGIDQAKAYRFESASKNWEPATEWDINVNTGAGARHIDMDLNREWLVLIGELSGQLFLYHKIEGKYQLVDTSSLEGGEMSAAAIRIHPNGRFVYFSERKTNSIYSFLIANGKLHFIEKCSCGGTTPRDISIDPSGKWLLAANQDNHTIAVFSIDSLTGQLEFSNSCNVQTPTCICWQ